MRKTARPVVWEGAEAQSSAPDPIQNSLERCFARFKGSKREIPAFEEFSPKPSCGVKIVVEKDSQNNCSVFGVGVHYIGNHD